MFQKLILKSFKLTDNVNLNGVCWGHYVLIQLRTRFLKNAQLQTKELTIPKFFKLHH